MILLLTACDGGADEGITLADANNYAYTNAIDVEVTDCAPGADVQFDWSGLTVDVQDHAMDPGADVTEVTALYFPAYDEAGLEAAIAADDLFMSDTQVILQALTGGATSIGLGDLLDPAGDPFDPAEYFTKEEGLWVFRITEDNLVAHSVAFFRPVTGVENSAVLVDNDSALVDFEAELEALEVVKVAPATSAHIDWSDLSTAGDGDYFDPNKIDQLVLGRYELGLPEIESQFFDLELIAAEFYELPVDRAEELSIEEADFGGFASGETWLLALRCTTCTNPAPPFLTVIEVE